MQKFYILVPLIFQLQNEFCYKLASLPMYAVAREVQQQFLPTTSLSQL